MENYADAAETTLVADNGATISVASADGFPAVNFRIRIGDELLLVTNVAGTDFTVTRGIESTEETTHSPGQAVKHVLTAGALAQIRAEYTMSGLYANRPAAGLKGRTYRATDNPYLYYDTGVAWQAYGPEMRDYITPPLTGWAFPRFSFSANVLQPVQFNADGDYAVRDVTAPYSVILAIKVFVAYRVLGCLGGVCWRESSTGKLHTITLESSKELTDPPLVRWDYCYNDAFTRISTRNFVGYPAPDNVLWVRLEDNNTNRVVSFSYDGGYNWIEWHSVARTTDLTPDQVGLFLYQRNVLKHRVELVSWEQS